MNRAEIKDSSDLRKYRTETPNTVVKGEVSKKLSVHEKFLYIYLKSVAGDSGKCWQSTKTLAEGTGMSSGAISKAKKKLAKINLIKIDKGDHKKGKSDTITITDIWLKNMQEYSEDSTPSPSEHPPSSGERTPSPSETPCSSGEPKKEPYIQEVTKEEESARDSFPERLEKSETVKELLALWFEYRKKKNKHPTLYEQDAMAHQFKKWGIGKSKKIILAAVQNGWMSLKEEYIQETDESLFDDNKIRRFHAGS